MQNMEPVINIKLYDPFVCLRISTKKEILLKSHILLICLLILKKALQMKY